MTYQRWTEAIEPKVQGSYNLHALLPKGMSFFIMLSSIAGAIGSTTQANYAAGCSYQDSLARHRTGTGEKATTLNLGVMLDDGVLTENAKMRNILMSTGYLMGITQRELYAMLEHHCDPSASVSGPLKTQVVVGVDVPASLKLRDMNPPTFMRRPPFRLFYNMSSDGTADKSDSTAAGNDINVAKLLSGASLLSEAANIISDALMHKLSKALAVPLENLDPAKAMHMYGVDSLVAVELRNWFAHALDADLAVFDILGGASFDDIGVLVAGKSRVVAAVLGESGERHKEG
jgi:KR domain/Phosphopantetheine attachment site